MKVPRIKAPNVAARLPAYRSRLARVLHEWRMQLRWGGRPLSQREAARLAGVSQTLWSRAERGTADLPAAALLAFLAEVHDALAAEPPRLFGGRDRDRPGFDLGVAFFRLDGLARSPATESPATRPAGIPSKSTSTRKAPISAREKRRRAKVAARIAELDRRDYGAG